MSKSKLEFEEHKDSIAQFPQRIVPRVEQILLKLFAAANM